jgi:hypothetical protein
VEFFKANIKDPKKAKNTPSSTRGVGKTFSWSKEKNVYALLLTGA